MEVHCSKALRTWTDPLKIMPQVNAEEGIWIQVKPPCSSHRLIPRREKVCQVRVGGKTVRGFMNDRPSGGRPDERHFHRQSWEGRTCRRHERLAPRGKTVSRKVELELGLCLSVYGVGTGPMVERVACWSKMWQKGAATKGFGAGKYKSFKFSEKGIKG